MELPLKSKFWTNELTNDTVTITASMGIKAVNILNLSAVAGSANGGETVTGLGASGDLSIPQNNSKTYEAAQAAVIDGLVISAPASCTLQITAML